MGGGGSIQGMITSLNNNKKLLRSKRFFKKERTFMSLKKEYFKAAQGELNFKEASKEDLLRIRVKIVKKRKKENLAIVISALIVISIFSYFAFILVEKHNLSSKNLQLREFRKKEIKFLALIDDGDEWFKKGKWQHSIYFYEEAKVIFPKNYDINYRLIRTYSFQCENQYKNCHTAKELLDQLFLIFPNKEKELSEIKKQLIYEY
ncbi:hypothetical protein [Bizionia arctica]|uniref:Tetratricopeptide repeat protein n=1 Tax=Bizionia arctica TaxID=1495645 RepID=A0A917GGQ1_9FLAO|nr:hypothetical protein [Bizionia arctica]GGG44734.1 hypothetical protein GCM10010976_15420 [Bizionia arctica]